LLNHIDVAEAFPALWKDAAPFEGKIRLGYLYGRGAYDMKSLGLAQAFAMRRLKRAGIVPRSDILFLAEASEEGGQLWGSRWLLEHRPEWFRGIGAVLNEGGDAEMILRTVRFWGIENVQAGYGLIEFEAANREPLKALASAWEKIETETVEPLPEVVLGFDMLANHLVHPLTDPLRHLDRVRRNRAELAALPDRYGSFLESRVRWFGPYRFPPTNKFRSYVVVSTPPGLSPDRYVVPIAKDAGGRPGIAITEQHSSGMSPPSPYLTRSGKLVPFVEMIRRVTVGRYPGIPFGPIPTFGGMTTSIYFRRLGIPAYGYPPVAANITDSARRHSNDERIFLRDYLSGIDLYGDILEEFALNYNSSTNPAEN
jgi:acetylornithine deacetylase/succinyl-diaminopimelate desuccinylase-like protein